MISVSFVLPSGLESFCLFSSVYGLLKSAGEQAFFIAGMTAGFLGKYQQAASSVVYVCTLENSGAYAG
jgi:hypothetical protein